MKKQSQNSHDGKAYRVTFYVDGYHLVRHLFRLGCNLGYPVIAIDQETGEEVERFDGIHRG